MKVMHNMDKISYDTVDEIVHKAMLPNGLTVYIVPKRNYSKTYGVFMTNYGSIDRKFVPIGEKEPIVVPDGIAHFLEHKLFEKETYDVFSTFYDKEHHRMRLHHLRKLHTFFQQRKI